MARLRTAALTRRRSGLAAWDAPRGRSALARLAVAAALAIAGAIPPIASVAPLVAPAAAATPVNSFNLSVQSARAWDPAGLHAGDAIPTYRWLIVKDDAGDSSRYGTNLPLGPGNSDYDCKPQSLGGDPHYPSNCQWPSIHSVPGGTTSEVVAEGDQTNLSTAQALTLPAGKYMISVIGDGFDVPNCTPSATVSCHIDGFKVDGNWFSLPMQPEANGNGLVTVQEQPFPLPLATVRARVWNDLQTNGAYDDGEPTLAGFRAVLTDMSGIVSDDWYGNPLCTTYKHDANGVMVLDANGKPVVQALGNGCFSDANGDIVIPYLASQRVAVQVIPPNGQTWHQTTTLEGWHDWDTWLLEGWNGFDPEFTTGGEPFPFAEFGFVQNSARTGTTDSPTTGTAAATGAIKGVVERTATLTPTTGGLPFGGAQGGIALGPVVKPNLSLIDLNRNDFTVYVGQGNADGTFQINHVPDGDYSLAYWDEDQGQLLTQVDVSVRNGQVVDLGTLDISGWWGSIHGKVCIDTNRNGKCDLGEQGVPNLTLNLLGRDNTLQIVGGDNAATTDRNGNYVFKRAYPTGQFVVLQGYWEQFYTVGITKQAINDPTETTVMANGGFVDMSMLNQIDFDTRVDWAIHPYESDPALGPTNGGIVGEFVYNTTDIETPANYNTVQPNEPGIPNVPVHLYAPVKCDPAQPAPTGQTCTQETTPFGSNYYLVNDSDGSVAKLSDSSGNPIDLAPPYTTETWRRPVNCTARDASGSPVAQQVLAPSTGGFDCLEAPLMESQSSDNSQTDWQGVTGDGQYVNGNYGFTQIDHDPTTGAALADPVTLPPGDYIVQPDLPKDANTGKPLWYPTLEESVNGYSGPEFVAPGETPANPPTPAGPAVQPTPIPAIPPFPCAGPQHTVHLVDNRADALFDPNNPSTTSGVYNPDYLAAGGSPFEGRQMPICSAQLVTVRNGRSATPNFYMDPGNEMPLPGRVIGLVVDDLNLSVNPKELFFGEKYGIPGLPVGIYDFANRLVKTVYTDPNGMFEVILPSTQITDCPTPGSVCPGMYRYVANDPGKPGSPNPGYNPAYRTIGAFFEVFPGMTNYADLAPTPSALAVFNPGTQQMSAAVCTVNDPSQPSVAKTPEFYSINKPYVRTTDGGSARSFTINGQYFGASQGAGAVTLDGTAMPITSWTDNQIVFTVPTSFNAQTGPHQLLVKAANGLSTPDGLTFHVLGGSYNPTVYEVGPGRTYSPTDPNPTRAMHAIQRALDAAATRSQALVVVYPGPTSTFNPLGSYGEAIVVHSPAKVQGVGPGGIRADGTHVAGTVLDNTGFLNDTQASTDWNTLVGSLNIARPAGLATQESIPNGEVVLFVASSATQYGSSYKAAIDGMLIQNGDVGDFTALTNVEGAGATAFDAQAAATSTTQGGGIFAYANARYLQITNNILRGNTGDYGAAIRAGTPLVGSNNNVGLHIAYNRIVNNGGNNLAGGVAIFGGANGYEVNNNDVCGNYSAEYGGGISHFGLSGQLGTGASAVTDSIHDNRVYLNGSYDEGGGIMVAGEPATTPTGVSAGAGPVNIYNNRIEANLGNDDGGGLRLLDAGNSLYNIYNNMIVANISTHEGGGVSLDNAPHARFFNNTVMKNVTTATAATSTGQPEPAGLATGQNNAYLQATLPAGSATFTNPVMFNNIFWDNRAGTWDPNAGIVRGIGASDINGNLDPTPIDNWDFGAADGAGTLRTTNSVVQPNPNPGWANDPSNRTTDPQVVATYDTSIVTLPWRGNPNFIANIIVAEQLPIIGMGNFHLASTSSPAYNAGAASKAEKLCPTCATTTVSAPSFDYDRDLRPAFGAYDIGADEIPQQAANLSITKTDGASAVVPGQSVTYTITAANAGPNAATGAGVTDTLPASLSGATWTCTASSGSACGAVNGTGNVNASVDLAAGGTATFTVTATLSSTATGLLTNTATVSAPAGVLDPSLANNSATDTDTIVGPKPALSVLDNFNRANANTLGANWSQATLFGAAAIRTNANQAFALILGQAIWNGAGSTFGSKQAAAFTVANAPVNGTSLYLKASGGSAGTPANFIRVQCTAGTVVVATTTTAGLTFTTRGTFTAGLALGDTLTATAAADGTVVVYKTSGATTTAIGAVAIPTSGAGSWTQGTGGGRIGIGLPTNARVDDFAGGTLP